MTAFDPTGTAAPEPGRCPGHLKDGAPCQWRPMDGSAWCYRHDPGKAADRAESARLGGYRRKRGKVAPDGSIRLRSFEDVVQLLERTAGDLVALDNGVQRGRALAGVAMAALKALEVGELEERLARLEEQHGGRAGAP